VTRQARFQGSNGSEARAISLHRPNEVVRLYGESDLVPFDDALPGFRMRVAEVFEM
jgi:hypothetical protein